MQLGVDTGNVFNYLQGSAVKGQPEPAIGMGVTFLYWSDRKAGTIQEITTIEGRPAIHCREDKAVRTDGNGMSDSQSYDFVPNPDGEVSTYRLGKNGRWYEIKPNPETKRWRRVPGGPGLRIGGRDAHFDYSL